MFDLLFEETKNTKLFREAPGDDLDEINEAIDNDPDMAELNEEPMEEITEPVEGFDATVEPDDVDTEGDVEPMDTGDEELGELAPEDEEDYDEYEDKFSYGEEDKTIDEKMKHTIIHKMNNTYNHHKSLVEKYRNMDLSKSMVIKIEPYITELNELTKILYELITKFGDDSSSTKIKDFVEYNLLFKIALTNMGKVLENQDGDE